MKNLLYIALVLTLGVTACKKDDEPVAGNTETSHIPTNGHCKLSDKKYTAYFYYKPYEEMSTMFAPKKIVMDSSWVEINENVYRKKHETLENVDTIVVFNNYGDIISFEYNDKYGTGERIEYDFDYDNTQNGIPYRLLRKQTSSYFLPKFHKVDYNFQYTGNRLDSVTIGSRAVVRYTYLTDTTRIVKHGYYGFLDKENYYPVEHLDAFGRVSMLDIRRKSYNTTAAAIIYTYNCD